MKKICGIYKITCTKNGKVRIGHSGDIRKRWSNYKASLRHNKYNIIDMQEDWNTYGEDSFTFEVVEECPKYLLKEKENEYILKYNSIENGYNDMLNDLDKKKKVRRGRESDNYKKQRSKITSGEHNGNARLSKEDVFDIFTMRYIENVKSEEIADKYGVHKNYVFMIGKDRWKQAYLEWQSLYI